MPLTDIQNKIQNLSPGGLRSSTLRLGHWGSSKYWIFMSWRRRGGAERRTHKLRRDRHAAQPLLPYQRSICDTYMEVLGRGNERTETSRDGTFSGPIETTEKRRSSLSVVHGGPVQLWPAILATFAAANLGTGKARGLGSVYLNSASPAMVPQGVIIQWRYGQHCDTLSLLRTSGRHIATAITASNKLTPVAKLLLLFFPNCRFRSDCLSLSI